MWCVGKGVGRVGGWVDGTVKTTTTTTNQVKLAPASFNRNAFNAYGISIMMSDKIISETNIFYWFAAKKVYF